MAERRDIDLQRLFELDAGPGPARSIDEARLAAIVAGALGGAGLPPPPIGPANVAAPTAAKGLAAGKLAVLLGGALGATVATVAWLALRAPSAPPSASVAHAPVPIVVPAHAPVPIVVPAPEPARPVDPAPRPIDAPAPPPIEVQAPPPISAPARLPARPPARPPASPPNGRRRVAKPVVARAEEPARAPAPAPRTPDDLLAEANAARAAHRWRDADALYARVASGEPAGLAAQAALIASATIHLEHLGDPAGAARRFRAALASGPRAALAEDARWGLAEAARATGDTAAERRALDDFLAHHAGSPRAPRARARRTELGAAP